jgi:hypothetical protein
VKEVEISGIKGIHKLPLEVITKTREDKSWHATLTGELTEQGPYTTPGECRDGYSIQTLHNKESIEL